MNSTSTDVLVVGGGPAGASVATRLARAGHAVTLVERRTGRSPFTRGDLLDPGAVRELLDLGVDPVAIGAHRLVGAQMWAYDRAVPVPWPDGLDAAPGMALRRSALNAALLDAARSAGVAVVVGREALTPIVERGFVRGATIADTASSDLPLAERSTERVECRFLVVADGANSRFGRGLGTTRDRNWPYAVSTSSHFASPRSDEAWADIVLGVPDRNGNPVAGHGWVAPLADGTVNVGVTVLSSYRDVLGVNSVKLFESFVDSVGARWSLAPDSAATAPDATVPIRRRTPLGGSIRPIQGPTFLVVGDAAGMANPFDSHGVGAALMTGRVAGDVLDEALTVGNSTTLQRYPARLHDEIGAYHKVGRLTARFLGRPRLLGFALRIGVRSEAAMGAAMRIATNELRDADPGGAERAYRLAQLVARFGPSW